MVHKKEDFFKRINDGPFVRSVDVVIDNPPYTGGELGCKGLGCRG